MLTASACPNLFIDVLLAEAKHASSRLWRRLALPPSESEDLRQELLADLLRRMLAFDPGRGTLGAFVGTVLRNHASRIASRVARERQGWNGGLLSVDTSGANGGALAETIAEGDELSAWRHSRTAITEIEQRLDLRRAIALLTDAERALLAAASRASVQELSDEGFGARATLYRRLRDIRCVLIAGGVTAC